MRDGIIDIISEQLEIDRFVVKENSRIMDELGADSLDIVDMLMAIEDRFGIVIPDEDVENLQLVGDVIDYVEKYA